MAGENRTCPTCEKEFYAPRWKLDDTARRQGTYCSRACKHEALTAPPSTFRASRQVGEGQLQCARCGEVKSAEDFGDDSRKLNGKKSYCRECHRNLANDWRQQNPERYEALKKLPRTELQRLRRRDVELQQKYHITLTEFEEILAGQGGGCAVCGSPPTGKGKSGSTLHVDHAHSCCPGLDSCGNCIRGLLCGNCNTLIGLAQESPDRLRAVIAYLEKGALAL